MSVTPLEISCGFLTDGNTRKNGHPHGHFEMDFFWENFFQSPQNFETSFRVFQKILRGSKINFFPNFYDSFSMTTQVVFFKKKGPKK
jgi:hypothetical protein